MINIDTETTKFAAHAEAYGNLWYRKGKVAYTHSGTFHADDVCSTALLEIVFPDIEVVRVAKVPEDAELAFDIGFGKYDHHQEDAKCRPDGTKYASFGLLWRDIGPAIISPYEVELFDRMFARSIDYTDNTGCPNPLSSSIKAMNPSWDSAGTDEMCFRNAVEFAKIAILAHLEKARSTEKAHQVVARLCEEPGSYPTPHTLALDAYMPYHREVFKREIWFVLYPSNRDDGCWNINTVSKPDGDPRVPFPESWFASKPKGCRYIHPRMNLATFSSKTEALLTLKKLEKDNADNPEALAGFVRMERERD